VKGGDQFRDGDRLDVSFPGFVQLCHQVFGYPGNIEIGWLKSVGRMKRTQAWDNGALHVSVEEENVIMCAAHIENQQHEAARVGASLPLLDLRQ
jgi:hypothetical protein